MLIGCFIEKREEVIINKKDGTTTGRFSGTVFRSWFSIFKKLYRVPRPLYRSRASISRS